MNNTIRQVSESNWVSLTVGCETGKETQHRGSKTVTKTFYTTWQQRFQVPTTKPQNSVEITCRVCHQPFYLTVWSLAAARKELLLVGLKLLALSGVFAIALFLWAWFGNFGIKAIFKGDVIGWFYGPLIFGIALGIAGCVFFSNALLWNLGASDIAKTNSKKHRVLGFSGYR